MPYELFEFKKKLKTSWREVLLDITNVQTMKLYIESTQAYLNEKEKIFGGEIDIYPPTCFIYRSFDHFNFEDTKVVILGQDPYHGKHQAMGLCFSVPVNIKVPPSLVNIYRELETDIEGYNIPKYGDLTKWSKQGVLLLNASLTVQERRANSHSKYWGRFTDQIIKTISDRLDGVVFLLWGNFARHKKSLIDSNRHHVLEARHPSPLSANRGGWFGCQHFSKTNTILSDRGDTPIDWQN